VRRPALAFALSMLAASACTASPRGPAPPPTPSTAPESASVAAVLPLVALRPAQRGENLAAQNDACEGCHVEVAAEWRASLHRASWTEPAFQRAYAREPLAFCRACHAPEAPVAADPSAVLGALGVGCVTCHVDRGAILAARAHQDVSSSQSASALDLAELPDHRLVARIPWDQGPDPASFLDFAPDAQGPEQAQQGFENMKPVSAGRPPATARPPQRGESRHARDSGSLFGARKRRVAGVARRMHRTASN
jgi:hypothetical protein